MNTDTGEFVSLDQAEPWMEKVHIGEVVQVKGADLEVVSVEGREMTLKLLSTRDRESRLIRELGNPTNRHERRRIEKLAKRR